MLAPHRAVPYCARPHRGVLACAGVLLVTVASLAACSGEGSETAERAAARVATDLSSGSLSADLFTDPDAQQQYDALVGGLRAELTELPSGPIDVAPTVEVASVTASEDGESAGAALSWSWVFAASTWTYDVSARLTKAGDTWTLPFSPALVEPTLQPGERFSVTTFSGPRADIEDLDGKPIVEDRPVVRIGIDKTRVGAARSVASARDLARSLDVSVGSFTTSVRAAGEKAFVEALVVRRSELAGLGRAWRRVPGAVGLEDSVALAPTRAFAAPILGRVGPATAELIEDSRGRLAAGDLTGLSGLQARYDEQLRGTSGVRISAFGVDTQARELHTVPPVPGVPLRLSVAVDLQRKAEKVLAERVAVPAALVAIRPSDGAILVAADGSANDGVNVATYGRSAPGSTFKIVSSLALLRSGLKPTSKVGCPAATVVDGKTFTNYSDYPPGLIGAIGFDQAVASSCNTAFITARDRLEPADLVRAAAALGFGVDQDLGFPAYFGQVPRPTGETEAAAELIGQGKVLASPMAMAIVAASVSSGRAVVPWLIDGRQPSADPAQPLTKQETKQLRSLLAGVVLDGSGRGLADVPGVVGAKTGTAEHGTPGPGGRLPTHAWMVALTDRDLVVAAYVEDGESGSSSAGPLIEAFLTR